MSSGDGESVRLHVPPLFPAVIRFFPPGPLIEFVLQETTLDSAVVKGDSPLGPKPNLLPQGHVPGEDVPPAAAAFLLEEIPDLTVQADQSRDVPRPLAVGEIFR